MPILRFDNNGKRRKTREIEVTYSPVANNFLCILEYSYNTKSNQKWRPNEALQLDEIFAPD